MHLCPSGALKQAAYRGQDGITTLVFRLALEIFTNAQVLKCEDALEGKPATSEQRVPVWQGR
jgi:hypothetical protein